MTVYVLLLTVFLSGGGVMSDAEITPTLSICQEMAPQLQADVQGKTLKSDNGEETATVLDAQAQCIAVTKGTSA